MATLTLFQRILNAIPFPISANNQRSRLSETHRPVHECRSSFTLPFYHHLSLISSFQKSCLLITLFNIDQICARIPLFTLTSLTCHRFVITSIAVSSKGLCDAFCPNNLYARVGGISVTELNVLEREFLSMIDWRLMVSKFLSLCFRSGLLMQEVVLNFLSSPCQCTREVLQEYYTNLARTHSSGKFYISGTESPSISSDSDDIDMDSGQSCPSSPSDTPHPSAVLLGPGSSPQEGSQRPTIEQNMAFAALQQSRGMPPPP